MEERNTSKKFLQSYLFTDKFGKFFISTCYRQSSGDPFVWFYETFAWRLDKDNHNTDWVADNSGAISAEGAFDQHLEVVRQLERTGKYEEVNDNEDESST
jgi:hypothetical protein